MANALLGAFCAGGVAAHGAEISVPVGASIEFGSGQAAFNCADLYVGGSVDGGSGQLSGLRDVTINGGTLTGSNASYSLSGNWSNSGTFQPGTGSVEFTDGCRATSTLTGNNTFHDLTFSSTAGKHFLLQDGSVQTIGNSLTTQGTPTDPVVLDTSGGSTPAVFDLADGAAVNRNNDSVVGGHVIIGTAAIPTLSLLALMLLAGALGWVATRERTPGLRA